jgi:hypothetical protein
MSTARPQRGDWKNHDVFFPFGISPTGRWV